MRAACERAEDRTNPSPGPARQQPLVIHGSRRTLWPANGGSSLPGNKVGSGSARGNRAFYLVHQQEWINLRQRYSQQRRVKYHRGIYWESCIGCEAIPRGSVTIPVAPLPRGRYFTAPDIETKACNATDQIQPATPAHAVLAARLWRWWQPRSPLLPRGETGHPASAGLSTAPARASGARGCGRVKGTVWIRQMPRCRGHCGMSPGEGSKGRFGSLTHSHQCP